MATVRERLRTVVRRVNGKRALLYFLCLAIPFSLENAVEILNVHPSPDSSLFTPVFLYQWAVRIGPRKPRAHFVRLVMIDRKTEPAEVTSETSPCAQRDFMARLLTTIATAQPAVIVLDKFYPNDNCTAGQSRLLVETVRAVARRIPIVLLRRDAGEEDLQGYGSEQLDVLRSQKAVVSFPTLDFGPDVLYGLKTLNADERRIPLDWPVYDSTAFDTQSPATLMASKPRREETLAVAAVRAYDPGTLAQQTIQSFMQSRTHPFTSFLRAGEIRTDAAIDLVCNGERTRDWRTCSGLDSGGPRSRDLRNRVIVIGQNHSSDIHRSVIGTIPGVVLQANYIESLLDDRYLKPAPLWAQLVISLIWLGIVEYLFDRWEHRPNYALALSATVIVVLWLLTYNIAVLQLGRYLVLWPPSAVAILSRYTVLQLKPAKARAPRKAARTGR